MALAKHAAATSWSAPRVTVKGDKGLCREGAKVAEFVLSAAPAIRGDRVLAGRLRLGLFIAIAAFIVGGPVAVQMFGVRSPLVRSWIMFSTPGLGVVDASFARLQADGSLLPLDRFAMLGATRDGKLRRIETREELASIARRLCDVAGPAADIRIVARQATRDGWRIVEDGSASVCAR